MRRQLAQAILELYSTAIQCTAQNPQEVINSIFDQTKLILEQMKNLPPLVTDTGIITVSEWLRERGVIL